MYHESLAIEHELEHTQKLAEVSGEIGCIAVDPEARRSGKGNALVGYLLRTAITRGCTSVFALTTRTAHYFIERGFSESTVSCLPTSKRASLDASRLSRVYVMSLAAGVRKLDEQEFMMGL
jgi:amino-acid N-acetyltransferase